MYPENKYYLFNINLDQIIYENEDEWQVMDYLN